MDFSKLLNKVHVGSSPEWLVQHIPDDIIGLTFTSPPVYDDELYIKNGVAEFGWWNYDEYIDHLSEVFAEILRITTPGGYLAIDTGSAPREVGSVALDLFPIVADVTKACLQRGWIFHAEVIWEKHEYVYPSRYHPPIPNSIVRQKHDQILVFKKVGEREECGKQTQKLPSVWRFSRDSDREEIQAYTKVYSTFPDDLIRRVLNLWSCKSDIILDPYAGSGQVVRVAKETERFGIGVEFDKKWRGLWKDL